MKVCIQSFGRGVVTLPPPESVGFLVEIEHLGAGSLRVIIPHGGELFMHAERWTFVVVLPKQMWWERIEAVLRGSPQPAPTWAIVGKKF